MSRWVEVDIWMKDSGQVVGWRGVDGTSVMLDQRAAGLVWLPPCYRPGERVVAGLLGNDGQTGAFDRLRVSEARARRRRPGRRRASPGEEGQEVREGVDDVVRSRDPEPFFAVDAVGSAARPDASGQPHLNVRHRVANVERLRCLRPSLFQASVQHVWMWFGAGDGIASQDAAEEMPQLMAPQIVLGVFIALRRGYGQRQVTGVQLGQGISHPRKQRTCVWRSGLGSAHPHPGPLPPEGEGTLVPTPKPRLRRCSDDGVSRSRGRALHRGPARRGPAHR